MSSSKSLFEDVKEALSNRKLGSFRMPLRTRAKMHKYAKRFCPFSLLFFALFAAASFSSEPVSFLTATAIFLNTNNSNSTNFFNDNSDFLKTIETIETILFMWFLFAPTI